MPTQQILAMAASFARLLVATLTAAVLSVWSVTENHDISTWGSDDVRTFALAVAGAALVTLVNYFRTGETRFGRGAQS